MCPKHLLYSRERRYTIVKNLAITDFLIVLSLKNRVNIDLKY